MQHIGVSIVVLCCFIAQGAWATQGAQDGDAAAAAAEQTVSLVPRTLRQECHFLKELLNVDPFNRDASRGNTELLADAKQKTNVVAIRGELTLLKAMIDFEMGVFTEKASEEASVPKYKGLNRYLFVKGLINSMAKKFESLKRFLEPPVVDTPEHLKANLIKLNFAKENEIKGELTLEYLNKILQVFYEHDGPIVRLYKLFRAYESERTKEDPLSSKSNPLSTFFDDAGNEGDALSELDKANAAMEIIVPRLISVPSPSPADSNDRSTNEERVVTDPVSGPNGEIGHLSDAGRTTVGPVQQEERQSEAPAPIVQVRESPLTPGEAVSSTGIEERREQPASRTQEGRDSRTSAPSTSETPSLRTATGEKSPQKASSAFDPFITVLLLASTIFAF
ncbi:merozoite surface glycoprotein, putative [Babesia ovata]|uniref:Merozoite surface glycoprotein, putative n=1 Tax=Babesia ovata TaxID=189622 RepID=A0A2H6KEF3_9APIC|nr:merozoite surface glycoprotein, putative [Babesia ovata]GBE61380.1 merozoite surface glycoprotein, putative [Babesia ovata]